MDSIKSKLNAVHYGTPVYKVVLDIRTRRELFQINSFGYGMRDLERYGVAARVARNLMEAPVWHYTDSGNLVCGDGVNIEMLPVRRFTIFIDDNLDFLDKMMCPCGSDRLAVHKLFGVGAETISLNQEKEGEEDGSTQYTSFSVILGDIRD